MHLDDLVLIKDNHIAITGNADDAVRKAKAAVSFTKKIEIEVNNPEDAVNAAEAGADIVMLDNFTPKQIRKTVELMKKKEKYEEVLLEASGGISADNLLEYASTGVDVISMGEITHSSRSLNLSLEITESR
jgi:nicotinate-nucleotide pyrophosphorylase (carboxylating)